MFFVYSLGRVLQSKNTNKNVFTFKSIKYNVGLNRLNLMEFCLYTILIFEIPI